METYVVKNIRGRVPSSEGKLSLAYEFKNVNSDSYEVLPEDVNYIVEVDYSDEVDIEVNDETLADMEIGESIRFVLRGLGSGYFVATGDAVILVSGNTLKLLTRYAWAELVKRSETEFYLVGDLET